jgi:hypothetical protein
MCRDVMLALALVCAAGGTAAAQWLSVPVAGTPRTPDGKPNLNACENNPDLERLQKIRQGR